MAVQELTPGLWRWTGHRPEWKQEIASCACATADGTLVIDPVLPEDPAGLWRLLDDAPKPLHVLITVFWHTRHTPAVVGRYDGTRVWTLAQAKRRIANRGGEATDVFELGDALPGGVQAFDSGRQVAELIYWLPEQRALVFGDVVLGGPLRLCPKSWLPRGMDHEALKPGLRPLLDLPAERLLVGHGEPVTADGRAALGALLA